MDPDPRNATLASGRPYQTVPAFQTLDSHVLGVIAYFQYRVPKCGLGIIILLPSFMSPGCAKIWINAIKGEDDRLDDLKRNLPVDTNDLYFNLRFCFW